MKSSLKLLSLSVLLISSTSCEKPITDDPISALNGLVQEYGFIGYENPLERSGTGVMLAGRPNALAYVAPANDCFPEDALVREYDTQHFNRTYNYAFQGNLGFTVFGSSLFSAGLGLDRSHTVNVELNGITIEYLSNIQVTDWYKNGMSETCREYLEDVGFVVQALITDSMKISITKIGGTNVGLTEENIVDFIDFNAGVDYQIIDAYTVEISTPKYIGYQLGRIRMEDEGRVLYRAMVALDDQFVFEPISLFDDALAEAERSDYVSDMDIDNIYLQ
ncbi:MAG: hypothetical protein CME65_13375 [Halobacteriovoraceae bacterium]|nr:hypothetical protein [Halobacteriovoraceae bacterium]|tara:strand:- start:24655 stop:25485 length:831 start_codon:yes stop_codon:yes gene_type:complete